MRAPRISRDIHNRIETDPSADVNEKEWLERLIALGSGELPAENLRGILQQIRASARGIEQPARVAYLGPEGSFCHQMALGYFGPGATFIETASVEEVLEEVVRGRAAYAAFPFESSVEGLDAAFDHRAVADGFGDRRRALAASAASTDVARDRDHGHREGVRNRRHARGLLTLLGQRAAARLDHRRPFARSWQPRWRPKSHTRRRSCRNRPGTTRACPCCVTTWEICRT
ncbi:MAG: prephenate dehydratase domain-containing protein [Pseudomonadota bacterium]